MQDEIDSLMKNQTWTLVEKPEGRNVVSAKWVFKSKTNTDGSLARRKARLVARGFSQSEGVDYFETFSPVVRYESVRTVLSLAAAGDMELRQFDVKTAFLNGKLEEEVFMQQPIGFDDGTGKVCRLNRAIYGLKQSPRVWNARFTEFLEQEKFAAIAEDSCVFVRRDGRDVVIVCLYVDDGLVCGTKKETLDTFITRLQETFDITSNEPDCYVGMEIERDLKAGTISIRQSGYIARVLERFGLSDARTFVTPIEAGIDFEDEDSKVVEVPYREAIGCLNFISLITRPDITFAVNALARYSSKPRAVHWKAVKRVMCYLKATIEYEITYGITSDGLIGFSDSDWGGERGERRSTTGYVFTLNGGPIAWVSRLQKTSALSVTEAEYMALADALCECLWIRPFLTSLGYKPNGATLLQVDNQAAIALSKNPEFHRSTKHVGVRYHRIRQEQQNKVVSVDYVPTEDNAADILTKGVSSKVLERVLRLVNMQINAKNERRC